MAVEVLVVRHGQSTWNADHRWQGQADPPLTRRGWADADALADALARSFPDGAAIGVHSSHLRRARATAERVALAVGDGTVAVDHRLAEIHAGPWEGLTPTEIEASWPGFLAADRRPPGFEPAVDVVARATAALVDIARATPPGGRPVAISHSGVIRSLRRSLGLVDRRVPNLAGAWFAVDGAVVGARWYEPPPIDGRARPGGEPDG